VGGKIRGAVKKPPRGLRELVHGGKTCCQQGLGKSRQNIRFKASNKKGTPFLSFD